ncbi:Agamous-like MADS-box protein AGL82 [Euphorbia peplus]|nr:Agamous-like MADS-box protein AGL82 [Euphorbia peplus]
MNPNDGSSISLCPSSLISMKNTYRKRKKTIKKKAEELSILCGLPVALISIEPTGKLDTWPVDRQLVHEILQQYRIKTTNAVPLRVKNNSGGERMKKKRKLIYDTWPSELDYWPEDTLVETLEYIESKQKILDERMLREEDDHEIRAECMASNP